MGIILAHFVSNCVTEMDKLRHSIHLFKYELFEIIFKT